MAGNQANMARNGGIGAKKVVCGIATWWALAAGLTELAKHMSPYLCSS